MLGKNKPGIIYLVLLFPLAWACAGLASHYPGMVERYYSKSIYLFLSQAVSSATGIFPFSVAVVLVILIFVIIAVGVVRGTLRLVKNPGNRLPLLIRQLIVAAAIVSVVYFAFIAVWGLNYHRVSIAAITNLEVREVSVEELEALCGYLIQRANGLRVLAEEDQNGVMVSPGGTQGILDRAYKGIGGIYFPSTGEANENISGPHFMIPFTASHEMAHQRGFAREDEANYIGYLACIMHPDPDFRYSGTMAALQYSMNALARQDRERYNSLREQYSGGVERDFRAWSEHIRKYEGIVKETTDRINAA